MSDGAGSCCNGRVERGENMKEMTFEPTEIQLIPIERTSLMPASEPKRDPAPIRKKRNRAIVGIEVTAVVSLAINVIQSVIIYILQAGPI